MVRQLQKAACKTTTPEKPEILTKARSKNLSKLKLETFFAMAKDSYKNLIY